MRMFMFVILLLAMPSFALEPMVVKYINNDPGVKHDYFIEVVTTALQVTEATYGPYRVDYSEELITSARKAEMLLAGDRVNISTISGFDRKAHPGRGALKVNVPLLRGFLGFRIPLIRRISQPNFDAVNSRDDLRKIPLGLGQGWEGYLYQKNGFLLTESLNMTVLLKMLVAGRFDFVPLGATEIENHYQVDGQPVDWLTPENHLLIYMPMPMFFYVNAKNPELAQRLFVGMKQMESDGKLTKIFDKYFSDRLKKLHLSARTVIEIPNSEDDGSVGKVDFSVLKNY